MFYFRARDSRRDAPPVPASEAEELSAILSVPCYDVINCSNSKIRGRSEPTERVPKLINLV